MNLHELQKQVFDQIDKNTPNSQLYKTKDIQKRLNVYHRGMKSRLKQALTADFEESIPLLKNFDGLFESFFKSIQSYHFSLSEYYKLWSDWILNHKDIEEATKALTHLERLQQDSYFKAYSLSPQWQSFLIDAHTVIINPSFTVEQFDWDVNENLKKMKTYVAVWTRQATVYTESISYEEFVVLLALIKGQSLEQSLSLIEKIYKKEELLNWLQNSVEKWTVNGWLILNES
ncbi:MAG: hypothetical protein MK008_13615 [Bdellovibrionales bacterium]|nr:hypothetical protein [Bdellovibrionales bacterium]